MRVGMRMGVGFARMDVAVDPIGNRVIGYQVNIGCTLFQGLLENFTQPRHFAMVGFAIVRY